MSQTFMSPEIREKFTTQCRSIHGLMQQEREAKNDYDLTGDPRWLEESLICTKKQVAIMKNIASSILDGKYPKDAPEQCATMLGSSLPFARQLFKELCR